MADAVTNGLPLPGLSTVTGALQGGVANLLDTGQTYLDRFFPPAKREQIKGSLVKFATERPYLASFLLSQIALSGPALALFFIMSITVLIFSLLAGILVGIIGALLFIVFAVGVALLFLLPTLFVTTFAGVFVWLWGLGAYLIVKWFNKTDVPGVHVPLKDGIVKQAGLDGIPLLGTGGEGGEKPRENANGTKPHPEKPHRKKEVLQEKKNANGHASKHDDEGEAEKENKAPSSASKSSSGDTVKKIGSTPGKAAGGVAEAGGGAAGNVTKKLGGVTGSVGLG